MRVPPGEKETEITPQSLNPIDFYTIKQRTCLNNKPTLHTPVEHNRPYIRRRFADCHRLSCTLGSDQRLWSANIDQTRVRLGGTLQHTLRYILEAQFDQLLRRMHSGLSIHSTWSTPLKIKSKWKKKKKIEDLPSSSKSGGRTPRKIRRWYSYN